MADVVRMRRKLPGKMKVSAKKPDKPADAHDDAVLIDEPPSPEVLSSLDVISEPSPSPVSVIEKELDSGAPPVTTVTDTTQPLPVIQEIGTTTQNPGKMLVSRHFTEAGELIAGSETGRDEKIEVQPFHGPVATVSVGFSHTINLGDFQSAKVSVTVTLPCYPEEARAALNAASTLASARMETEVAEVKGVPAPTVVAISDEPSDDAELDDDTGTLSELPEL